MAPINDASRNAIEPTKTHSELVEAELARIGEHAREQRTKRTEDVTRAVRDNSDQCPENGSRIDFAVRPGAPTDRSGVTIWPPILDIQGIKLPIWIWVDGPNHPYVMSV
jgi:hypothetical protein